MSFISYENGQTLFGKVGNAIKGQEGLLSDTVGWTGKNRLDTTYPLRKVASGTQLDNLTATRRSDGAVVLNGSTSGTGNLGYIEVYKTTNWQFDGMILSGRNGNAVSAAKYGLWDETASRALWIEGNNEEVVISGMNGHSVRVTINIYGGNTFNNMVFPAMIRDARISDSTYEQHHESVEACKADNSVIAPVESGSTASQAYAIGEHFVKGKSFCTAVAAIAIGDTLTAGTNYNSRSIGADINYQIHATTRGGYGTQITSGNLNDIKTLGLVFWSTSDATNISNLPTGLNASAACYITETYPGYLRQTIIMREADTIYTRRWNGSAWSNWVKIEPTSV